jgi:hypothetical protein
MVAALISIGVASGLSGCNGEGDGLSNEQRQAASDIGAWAKRTDGDWNKLSETEKASLIKSLGTEEAAKNVLKMKAHPPGPPANIGPPSGAGKKGGPDLPSAPPTK